MPWTTHTIVVQTEDAYTNTPVYSSTIKMVAEHVPTSAYLSFFIPGLDDALSVQAEISVDNENWVNQGTALTASGSYEFPDVRAEYLRFKVTNTQSTQNNRDFGAKVTITIAGYVEVNNNHNITKLDNDYVYGNESILIPLYDNEHSLTHLNIIGDSTCDASNMSSFGNWVRQATTSWFPKRWKGVQIPHRTADYGFPFNWTMLYHATSGWTSTGQAIASASGDTESGFKQDAFPPTTRYEYLYRTTNYAKYAICSRVNTDKMGRFRISRFNILRGAHTNSSDPAKGTGTDSDLARQYVGQSDGSGQSPFTGPLSLGPRKFFLDENENQFFDAEGNYSSWGYAVNAVENSTINFASGGDMVARNSDGGSSTTLTDVKMHVPGSVKVTSMTDVSTVTTVSWPSATKTYEGTDNWTYNRYEVYPFTTGRPAEDTGQESSLDALQNRGAFNLTDDTTGAARSALLFDATYVEHNQEFGLRIGSIAKGGKPTEYHSRADVTPGVATSLTNSAPDGNNPSAYSDEALAQRMHLDGCDLFMFFSGLNDVDYRGSDNRDSAGDPAAWVLKVKAVLDRYRSAHKKAGRSGYPKFIIVTPWNIDFKYTASNGATATEIQNIHNNQTECVNKLLTDIVNNPEYSEDVVLFDLWGWQKANFNIAYTVSSNKITNDLATAFNCDGTLSNFDDETHVGYRGMELCCSALWAAVIRAYDRKKN